VRLPYVNLRWVAASLVVILLAALPVVGWGWWNRRPEKRWEAALDYYHQGENFRGVGKPTKPSEEDKAKARTAYEKARTQVEQFMDQAPKDPRMAEAQMLRFKVLWPLAGLKPDEAATLQNEAFRSGQVAARLDDKNIEAQAVMVFENFSQNNFSAAYPYARTLVDNLTPEKERQVELDDFNDYVIGAYYVLALKDLQNNHPDDALKDLEAGQAREKARPNAPGKPEPRWRSVLVEVLALQKKIELSAKDPTAAKKAEDRLKTVLNQSVERARNEAKEMVPAADGKPEMPRVATMSLTNSNGLIDVLLAGVVKADSHQTVADRADVLMQVCEKMAGTTGAAPHVYQEAVRGSSRLVFFNGGLPAANRLTSEEMVKVQAKAVAINDTVQKNGGAIDPSAYLDMSRTVLQTQNDRPRALEVVKRGLKVAADQHLPAKDPRVLALQSQAAWLLLLDRKVKEAEEYLAQIALQSQLSPDVAYMRGLGAVLDGRLDEGVKQLSAARTSARFKDTLPLLLGLSNAYLGMGQMENAAPVLEEVIKIRKVQEGKNREDEPWINVWQPTLTHSTLDLLRCYLTLALKITDKKEAKTYAAYVGRADELSKELKPTFLANDALAAWLNFDMARLRALEAKDPNSIEADVLRGKLTEMIGKLPPTAKDDPRVLWSEVNLILGQKETNPAVVGGAVAAPFGAPTDLAVRLGELGRLRAGAAWQWAKAEERITSAAAAQKDSLPTQLAWVRWQVINGRQEDALAKLSELEDKASTDQEKRRIRAARVGLLLAEGKKEEADKIIQTMRGQGGEDVTGDLLYVKMLLDSGDPAKADEVFKNVLNKHDQTGLYHYWKGQTALAGGDFMQAIQSYERSLEFVQFKALSENAILACVQGIQNGPPGKPDKANPEAALKEARRLRTAHPRDPAVLFAFAAAARVMDEVYGDDAMEGALNDLMKVLAEDKALAANGPYVAAQQWVAAGRPDRARKILEENRKHLPSLALAIQLAIADEDWAAAADDLKAVTALQPDLLDLPLWRAALHEARGESKEAKEIYTKFIEDNPKLNTGYLAMARLHERAKEYKEALAWVKKWREKMPDEVNGINALIRVLAEDGQAAEASKAAEDFIKDQVAKAKTAREEWEAKNPITEKDKDKAKEEADNRAKVRESIPDTLRLSMSLQFVTTFQKAKAFAEAERWLDGVAVPLLDKLPEDVKKSNRDSIKMVRASIAMSRGRQLKENDPERARLMDLAIKGYDEVYKDLPGDLISGNNLAWLYVKEKNDPNRAVALVDEVRKGKHKQEPVSPERLPVEFLDTIGTVYQASGRNQESFDLFKQAVDKHYVKEPRVLIYLGRAQQGLQRKADAYATFDKVINLATNQAKATPDPERKERLEKLIADARKEQKNIGIVK
jgi:tetratricopeptide (TPR) repeat protein